MLKKRWLWIPAAAAAAIYLAWTVRYSLMSDEIEHLHAAWLISQGLLPFRDFWEHHSPLLWVVLAPILRVLPETGDILYLARAGCFLFSGALLYLVWAVSKLLWKEEADPGVTALFFFSGAVLAQHSFIRPDPFMLFFIFASLYLLIRAFNGGELRYFLYSGFCMAFAFSFSPKWIAALPLIPVAIALSRPGWAAWLRMNLLCGAGFALGLAPLLAYLFGNGIAGEFTRWVFQFNKKEILFMGYWHPTLLALAAAGFLGAAAAWGRLGRLRGLWALLGAAVLFSTFFIYKLDIKHSYYAASLLLFVCTLASGFLLLAKRLKSAYAKAALWTLLLAALFLPNVQRIVEHEARFASFGRQVRLINWLAGNFRGETVTMVYPWHPVFANDVGILQMSNFFEALRSNRRGYRDYVRTRPAWTQEIIDSRPSVIAKWEVERIVPVLVKAGLITRADYETFIAFLKSEYAPVTKDGATFLLRKGHPAARTADKVGQFTS
jgi:hypothetical protein